jgi:hypothetical protein
MRCSSGQACPEVKNLGQVRRAEGTCDEIVG